jgi:hypothetical protein
VLGFVPLLMPLAYSSLELVVAYFDQWGVNLLEKYVCVQDLP